MKRDIHALIAEMTLEEKAGMCSGAGFWHLKGIERLGIPSVMVTDGPHGLRKQQGESDHLGVFKSSPATCFPSAAGMASSWNRELIGQVGVALGEECQAEDVAVLLGPGGNIKRSPLCGRNFEYFSEDPYLSSEMATYHIQGVQSQGVGTSLKHFAVNNQEYRRFGIDAIVDERTLREIYLASFEGAIKNAQPWTVMSAYNKVNGAFASENEYLLNQVLKEEWGHEGFVVTDWGANNERVDGLAAGQELEMPASDGVNDRKIVKAIQNGQMSEEVLDRAVERILRIIFKYVDQKKPNAEFDLDEHHRLARHVAGETMVLLKNEDHLLPLAKGQKLAVIGSFAQKPRYQGGGSSHVNPTRLDIPLEEIKKLADDPASVIYAQGYHLDRDDSDAALVEEAKQAALAADVVVIFAGLPDRYESEGYDRKHLRMPANQEQLIAEISKVQSQTVVILMNGSPIEMPWLAHAKSILEAYLGGQATGGAIADLLFGEVNPSGKLAESFPIKLSDNPSFLFFPGEGNRVEYREGIFVGYRYYDKKEVVPLFPFGHGLSYTTFEYSNLYIDRKEIKDTNTVNVQVTVKNIGTRAGKETVQLYVSDIASTVVRPVKELKGFAKVDLQPKESKTVSFTLDKRSFAYYNVEFKDWHVESGDFDIMIGRSSADIVLSERIYVESSVVLKIKVDRNTLIADLLGDPQRAPIIQGLLHNLQEKMDGMFGGDNVTQSLGEGAKDMVAEIMNVVPLRMLSFTSKGEISDQLLDNLIRQLNEC
ncbi:glycosyl hydrolase [Paenibacillus chitinolyticus]|uniref:Glycoside hydrolase family 3 C-terminal domain-containing protein n=1 Tax=Paenibacillus chitinolyticus TaxID=79263 RepID=A0A410WXU9_9BACL|nr:glycoside hydrolase family 3 C-terminal domain-containing protein [Paenibacillus chitinolyticus]MCY9589862.1 glycoside hydrolase family 3 C-terminal domain-containing protein [Paenibacillus chitinolyticus]MCY9598137.1 glycoside hydrolase family 3 C-terminal domain-containing protein [Paenibacillus chitinolyticus]QAV19238.1 glycosyl hydrolase [Paenibacillus chitinolyticus]